MLIIMWYTVYCFTKVPPKCRWTEQHSGNNRIYFQWMHSGIEKKDMCRFKRRDILNCHGNLDRAFQGIIESMLMKKKAQALLFPGFPDQIFGNHTGKKYFLKSTWHLNVLTGAFLLKIQQFALTLKRLHFSRRHRLGHADY